MVDGNGQHPGGRRADELDIGALLKRLSDQTRRLAQQEVELAKTELAGKAKVAGVGAGLLVAAGLLGLLALMTLTATIVLALATAVAAWLAALIVTGVYLAGAAALGLIGRARIAKAAPLAPTQALASVKEDVTWLKSRAKFART
jgi:hypothetical protein